MGGTALSPIGLPSQSIHIVDTLGCHGVPWDNYCGNPSHCGVGAHPHSSMGAHPHSSMVSCATLAHGVSSSMPPSSHIPGSPEPTTAAGELLGDAKLEPTPVQHTTAYIGHLGTPTSGVLHCLVVTKLSGACSLHHSASDAWAVSCNSGALIGHPRAHYTCTPALLSGTPRL